MDDSPTSRSRGRAPTFSFHDLDNPPLSSPSVGAAQPSSPSILLSPKRGNVRTSRTKNSPTRTQLTTAFANKGKFAHPKTEKVWKYPSATNQKAVPQHLLDLPKDPTLNKSTKATRNYKASFLAVKRTSQPKCFRPYEVPPPSVGTYDAKDPAVEDLGRATSTVPFRSTTKYHAVNPTIATIGMYPNRTRHSNNNFDMSDWETDIYKRRGEVESYQPRLSQNYAQADLVTKRLEDDNRASLSFMKSKSTPVLGLRELNNPVGIGPGEFFDPAVAASVRVKDVDKKSWFFRSKATRERLNVSDRVKLYIEMKKRELERDGMEKNKTRGMSMWTEGTDNTATEHSEVSPSKSPSPTTSKKMRSYTMDVNAAFQSEDRFRLGTGFGGSAKLTIDVDEEEMPQRPNTTMSMMSPNISHSIDFNGFHSVTRTFKDKNGKNFNKVVRKRGPTAVVGKDNNFDVYSMGYGNGKMEDGPTINSYNPDINKRSESKRVMAMTHVFKGGPRFPKKKAEVEREKEREKEKEERKSKEEEKDIIEFTENENE